MQALSISLATARAQQVPTLEQLVAVLQAQLPLVLKMNVSLTISSEIALTARLTTSSEIALTDVV